MGDNNDMQHALFKQEMASLKQWIGNEIDHIVRSIDKLTAEQKTTNGRVKKLELRNQFLTGGLTVIIILILPILFIIATKIINGL